MKVVNIDTKKYTPENLFKDIKPYLKDTKKMIVIRETNDGRLFYGNTDIGCVEAVGLLEVVKNQYVYEMEE